MFGKSENQTNNVLFISYLNRDSLMEMPALLTGSGCTVDLFSTETNQTHENKYYRNSIKASSEQHEFFAQLLMFMGDHNQEYQWIIPGDSEINNLLNHSIESEELLYKIMPASIYKTAYQWSQPERIIKAA